MAGKVGRAIVLTWNGAQLSGVQQKDLSLNGEPLDVTDVGDDGWRDLLEEPGQKDVNVSLSGIDKANTLKVDWFSDNRLRAVQITYPNGDVIAGNFYLASYSEGMPYNGATTFSAELQSAGEVTFTPAE